MALTEAVAGAVLPSDGSATPKFFQGFYDASGGLMYAPRVDNSTAKNLRVSLYDSLGNPLLIADDAAFTVGTSRVVPMGALADETAPDSVDEGDVGIPRMTLNRLLRSVPTTAAGSEVFSAQRLAADNLAYPTAPDVLAWPMLDDGATGDKMRAAAAAAAAMSAVGLAAAAPQLYDASAGNWRAWGSAASGDGQSAVLAGMVNPVGYNTATVDRWRNNTEGTLLASAARTATNVATGPTNYNARGVMLFLNITANPGGGETLTVSIEADDPASSEVRGISGFTAATTGTNSMFAYLLYPGAVETLAVSNVEVTAMALPRSWQVRVTHSAAGSWTYSLGYALIL